MTFREFVKKQRKPEHLTVLLDGMPEVESWAEVRKYLNARWASEIQLVVVRRLWRKYRDSIKR